MDPYYLTDEHDAETYDKKKSSVTELLEKRNNERLGNIVKLKQIKDLSSNEQENLDEFEKNFISVKNNIEKGLNSMNASMNADNLTTQFDQFRNEIDGLQKEVTMSTGFLPAYTIKRYQDIIQELFNRIDSMKDVLIPKKKFGFRSRNKAPQENKPHSEPFKSNENCDTATKQRTMFLTNSSMDQMLMDSSNNVYVNNKVNENLILEDFKVLNKDLVLQSLQNCNIKICGNPGTVYLDNIENCTIYCGPVSRSMKIDHCYECNVHVACQQLRIHNTKSSRFYIHVMSGAIIEDSTDLKFGKYEWSYDNIHSHYQTSGLDMNRNLWDDVKDFNRLASNEKSPNWSILE